MFQHNACELGSAGFQYVADDLGVLIDDGRVRADVDDTVHTPFRRVIQGETQAGERLASTGGDSQEVGAFRTNRGGQTGFRDLPSKVVNRRLGAKSSQFMFQKSGQRGPRHVEAMLAQRRGAAFTEIGSVCPVSVDQAANQESNQETDLELADRFILVNLADPCDSIAEAAYQIWIPQM